MRKLRRLKLKSYFDGYIYGFLGLFFLECAGGGMVSEVKEVGVSKVGVPKVEAKVKFKQVKQVKQVKGVGLDLSGLTVDYLLKRYDSKKKGYRFLEEDRLLGGEGQKKEDKNYYRVSYNLEGKILRVEGFKQGKVSSIEEYEYEEYGYEGGVLKRIEKFSQKGEKKSLRRLVEYDGKGVERHKGYDEWGREYGVKVEYGREGIVEEYRDGNGLLSHRIGYDGYGQKVRYDQYVWGRLDFWRIYEYEEGRLGRISEYRKGGDLKGYEEYDYGKEGFIGFIRKYNIGRGGKGVLELKVRYNGAGRMEVGERYDKKGGLKEVIEYDGVERIKRKEKYGGGKNWLSEFRYYYMGEGLWPSQVREYDRSQRLKRRWEYWYNVRGQVILRKEYEKGKLGEVSYKEYDKKSGYLKKEKFFKGKKMQRVLHYDIRRRLSRIEIGKGGELEWSLHRRYNDQDELVEEIQRGKTGVIEQYTLYSYEGGRKIQEDGYDRRKQYLGSIKYEYGQGGYVRRKRYYNYRRRLYRVEIFNRKGKRVKVRDLTNQMSNY